MAIFRLPLVREVPEDQIFVVTGIGLLTALGRDRETTWQAIRQGRSAIGWIRDLPGIPDDTLFGAQVSESLVPRQSTELRAITYSRLAAAEALDDARLDPHTVDRSRMACALSGHMGDLRGVPWGPGYVAPPTDDPFPWWTQIFPNTACQQVAGELGLGGPRLSHSTACASGLISLLTAVRAIRDGQCDVALAGGGECLNPLFAAGFRNMRALADGDDPRTACLPFDQRRKGFVMGEGAAVFVVERLSHALRRGARVYCRIHPGVMLSEAHHLTGLDIESDSLPHLIRAALRQAELEPHEIGYINAHGTGTQQNDAAEISGVSRVFADCLDSIHVSATKSMIGHLVKAAGCVELAVTILGLRDRIAPPTVGLEQLEPNCRFDCVPRQEKAVAFDHALKLSLAFGGHLVGVVVSRWGESATGVGDPHASRSRAA